MFGYKIRKLRMQKGWTLAQLSEKTGFTVGSINQYELGRRANPNHTTVLRFAVALDTTADYLMREDDEEPAPERRITLSKEEETLIMLTRRGMFDAAVQFLDTMKDELKS